MHRSKMKSLAAAVAALCVLPFAAAATASPASAAIRPASAAPTAVPADAEFTPRFDTNAAGDIRMIANTLMSCQSGATGCADARDGKGSKLNNNNWPMQWIDVDTDSSTVNSSESTLTLPESAQVLFAGLYWGAGDGDSLSGSVPAGANTVKFKVPGATDYRTLTATSLFTRASNRETYSAFADVTSLVGSAKSGTYTVADVRGRVNTTNVFAGWTLIVAYGDSQEPVRALTIFDGLRSVGQNATVDITVSGFKTPATGPVRTTLGVVSYEGDLGATGDQLQMKMPNGTFQALGNSVRPATNFFNATITQGDAYFTDKFPNYKNQLGYDAGTVDADGKIANSATSATFRATSSGDVYYPVAMTFATELFSPRYDAQKSVTDLNGDTPRVGDVLQYNLSLTNDTTVQTGEVSAATVVTDVLPAGITYVPGSLTIDGTSIPDTGSRLTISGQTLSIRVGTGANVNRGGDLNIGAHVDISFQATIDPGVANGSAISNRFTVGGAAKTSGFSVAGTSNDATVYVDDEQADLSITKAAVPAGDGSMNFNITVANAGPSASGPITVVDTIAAPALFSGLSSPEWACSFDDPTLTCTHASLDSGASADLTIPVAFDPTTASGTPGSNTATVSGTTPDPDPANNTSTATYVVNPVADLSIRKTHEATNSDGTVSAGGLVTYNLVVTNLGPFDAPSVVVADTLPAGMTAESIEAPFGWLCTGTTAISCSSQLESLTSDHRSAVIKIAARIDGTTTTSTVVNTAAVTSVATDPNPSNNSASDSTDIRLAVDLVNTISYAGTLAPSASFPLTVIGLNAGPGSLDVGTVLTQTVTLPTYLDFNGSVVGPWTCDPSVPTSAPVTLVCESTPLGTEIASEGVLPTLSFDVLASGSLPGPASLDVTAVVTSTQTEVETGNNSASLTLESTAIMGDLELTSRGYPTPTFLVAGAGAASITFDIQNTSMPTSQGPYQVRFDIPAGLTISASAGSAWTCTAISGVLTCTLPATPVLSGAFTSPLNLDVEVTDPAFESTVFELQGVLTTSQPDWIESAITNNVAVALISSAASSTVSLDKTGPATALAGDTVTYTVSVTNDGPSVARDLVVTDLSVADELEIVSATYGTDCSTDAFGSTCAIDSLAVGARADITVVARVNPGLIGASNTVTNRATVTLSTGLAQADTHDITVSSTAAMSMSKTIHGTVTRSGVAPLVPGQNVVYDLDVTNLGPSMADQVTVTDPVPAGTEYITAEGDNWICGLAVGNIVECVYVGTIPPGSSLPTIVVTLSVNADATGSVVNTATATPLAGEGTPGSGTITVPIADPVDLDIAASGKSRVQGGENWIANLSVRNDGPGTESGPVRVNIKVEGAVGKRASGKGWTCTLPKHGRITLSLIHI